MWMAIETDPRLESSLTALSHVPGPCNSGCSGLEMRFPSEQLHFKLVEILRGTWIVRLLTILMDHFVEWAARKALVERILAGPVVEELTLPLGFMVAMRTTALLQCILTSSMAASPQPNSKAAQAPWAETMSQNKHFLTYGA